MKSLYGLLFSHFLFKNQSLLIPGTGELRTIFGGRITSFSGVRRDQWQPTEYREGIKKTDWQFTANGGVGSVGWGGYYECHRTSQGNRVNFIETQPKSSTLTRGKQLPVLYPFIKFAEEYLHPPAIASGTISVFPGKEIQDHGNSTSMEI